MKKIFLIAFAVLLGFSVTAQSYKGSTPKTPQERLNEEYCSGLFKSTDGTIFDIAANDNAFGYLNILDWLEGRVAGLQIFKSRIDGSSIPVIRGTVASVYLDEMPVSLSTLNSLSSADIGMIKVIKTPFMGGFNGGGGAIAIYTWNVEDEDEEHESK